MRKPAIIISVVVTLLAAGLAWTQRELGRLRDENTDLRSRLEDALRHRNRAKMQLRELEKRYTEGARPAATPDAKETATAMTTPPPPGDGPPPGEPPPRQRRRGGGRGFRDRFSRMLQDPKMREAMWERHRYGLDRHYAALFKKLTLTPEELTTFKDILTDRRMAWMLTAGEEQDRDARAALVEQRRAELDADLLELLGEAQYEQFENYEATAAERHALERLNERLTESAIPMSDVQQETMANIMLEERNRLGIEAQSGRRGSWRPDINTQEEADAYIDTRRTYNDSVYARSEGILTEDQRKELKAEQDRGLEGLELHLKMRLPADGQTGGG